ncbi:MAG: response regulator [Thiotrichaceae bacterium]|nr:response regulator [Thiotrichaceae bacterium]
MQTQALKILIIDDEPQNLRLIIETLNDYGFDIMTALNGKDALYSIYQEMPELILLDIIMPKMTGFEVCQKLKQRPITQNIPIIFLTALDDVDSKLKAFQLGGIDYITKPIDAREVLVRVNTHLDRHRIYQNLVQRLQNYEQQNLQDIDCNENSMEGIEKVRNFLEENIATTHSLEELAQIAGTNRTHLNKYFRILFGETVFGWLREQRLQRAAQLLCSTDKPIQILASEVGYENNTAFSTAFKKRFGMTPVKYRFTSSLN